MKKSWIFLAIFLAACAGESSKQPISSSESTATSVAPPTTNPLQGCYLAVIKSDSTYLSLQINDGSVTGQLTYRHAEKDNNTGTLSGVLKNDLIIADYTFQSEGKTSVRQVVFKTGVDRLTEGFGEIDMKGDTARFKNVSHLEFDETNAFVKTSCP